MGGVGVLATAREFGSCEDGGGVMDEVVGGAGDVNLTRSGERALGIFGGAGDSDGACDPV